MATFYELPCTNGDKPYFSWSINGRLVTHDARCAIPIHYPDFDTIILNYENERELILTSLKKGHIYALNQNNGTIEDITENRLRKHRKPPVEKDTLKVVFRYKNLPKDTMIAGTFGWVTRNFTHGKIFNENTTAVLEETQLRRHAGYSYDIRIGYGTVRREIDIYNDSRFLNFNYDEEHVFVFDEELIAFEYQFFDKKTLYVHYDGKSRTYSLKLK